MNLKITRMISGVTQWGVCKKTGIFQAKLSLIENGYVNPSVEEREKIAKALNVGPRDIEWSA